MVLGSVQLLLQMITRNFPAGKLIPPRPVIKITLKYIPEIRRQARTVCTSTLILLSDLFFFICDGLQFVNILVCCFSSAINTLPRSLKQVFAFNVA
jgi:hypothetical protein